jgi:hypothetical protein
MENNNVEFLECRTCIFRNVSKPKKTLIQICNISKEKIKAKNKACENHDFKTD